MSSWEERLAKHRERSRAWHAAHPEYAKQYYQEHRAKEPKKRKGRKPIDPELKKQHIKEYTKRYYQEHKEEIAKRQNTESARQRRREWLKQHAEECAKQRKEYYEKNKEHMIEMTHIWRANRTPEQIEAENKRRRERYALNRDYYVEKSRQWHKRHPYKSKKELKYIIFNEETGEEKSFYTLVEIQKYLGLSQFKVRSMIFDDHKYNGWEGDELL